MRFLSLFLSLSIVLGSMAQNKDYILNIGDFSELTIASSINVIYKNSVDSVGTVLYSCPPSVASSITFSNNKNKLKIQLMGENIPTVVPTITVYSLSLSKASNWGDSTLVIERTNPSSQFKLKVENNGHIICHDIHTTKLEASVDAGHGHIYLTGKAKEAKYAIHGAGSIEAGNVEASIVKCSMWGPGSIDCFVTESLTIKGTGPGSVYYRGKPATLKDQGISVKVIEIK